MTFLYMLFSIAQQQGAQQVPPSGSDLLSQLVGLFVLLLGGVVLLLRVRIEQWVSSIKNTQKAAEDAGKKADAANSAASVNAVQIKTNAEQVTNSNVLMQQLMDTQREQNEYYREVVKDKNSELTNQADVIQEMRLKLNKLESEVAVLRRHGEAQDALISQFLEWAVAVLDILSKRPDWDELKRLLPPVPKVKATRKKVTEE